MSRTHEPGPRLTDAIDRLQRMMDQGRSFSGRERNCCFLNTTDGRFANVSAGSGLDFPDDGRCTALVDWDQDGDLDAWISNRNAPRLRFMRNQSSGDHHWLALRLQGNGKTTSRDAIGARVVLVAEGLRGKHSVRTLHAGDGFLSQSSKWLHFGLGQLNQIEKVRVYWPGGNVEEFEGIKIDQRLLLVQGAGVAKALPQSARKLALKAAAQKPVPKKSVRVPLVSLLPMPKDATWVGFDGSTHRMEFGARPTLIVLWAGWCAPCRAELRELAERQKEIRSAGIDVLALAVDGLGKDSGDPANARSVAERLKFPFPVGRAQADFVQMMTGFHHMLVALTRPLPIPTSILVDRKGRMSVIYKGRIAVDDLLRDAGSNPRTIRERWIRSACLKGRMINDDRLLESLRRAEAATFVAIGTWFSSARRFAGATEHFQAALHVVPNHGRAHLGLALAYENQRNDNKALEHYTKAEQYLPGNAMPHFGLGNIHMRAGRHGKAVARYQKAISLDKKLPMAHMNLGTAFLRMNRPRDAAQQFRRALEIDPNFTPARTALQNLNR